MKLPAGLGISLRSGPEAALLNLWAALFWRISSNYKIIETKYTIDVRHRQTKMKTDDNGIPYSPAS